MPNLRPALALLFVSLTFAAPALAESPAPGTVPERRRAAEALFDEARNLMAAQRYAEACPKFAESQSLDAAVGTLLNLALCHEKLGKTASAFRNYRRAAAAAREKGQTEREEIAKGRAAALESRLSMLVITRPPSAWEEGLELRADGERIAPESRGEAIPVDPGECVITASAPGKRALRLEVTIPARAGSRTVAHVPTLEDLPGEGGLSAASRHKIAAGALGGAALISIVVGSALGAQAISRNNASQSHCIEGNLCDAQGVVLRDEARLRGDVSTAAFIVGGAAAAGAITVWLTAPSKVQASVGGVGSGAGLLLGGAF